MEERKWVELLFCHFYIENIEPSFLNQNLKDM